jgi:hypothetical protein
MLAGGAPAGEAMAELPFLFSLFSLQPDDRLAQFNDLQSTNIMRKKKSNEKEKEKKKRRKSIQIDHSIN